jgi:hypothetical protein
MDTIDDLVKAYRNLRGQIEAEEESFDTKVKALKADLEVVTAGLLEFCNAQNLDSIRTPAGTVSRRVQTRYWTNDWERFYKFVQEREALHLFEKRIHNGNMQQFLEENPDLLPIGLQIDRKFIVQVRKPKKGE